MIIKVVTIWAFKAGVHINGVYSDPLQQHRFWKFPKEGPSTLATYITLILWSRGTKYLLNLPIKGNNLHQKPYNVPAMLTYDFPFTKQMFHFKFWMC